MANLAIKYNNCSSAEPCALCGRTVDQDVGLALFMADSYEQVCDACAATHAPELLQLLTLHRTMSVAAQCDSFAWPVGWFDGHE